MTIHLVVLVRYLLTIALAGIGGALAARGWVSPETAGLLISDPFIEAATAFVGSGLVYVFYLFSESAKANRAWTEWREAMEQ